eukprot:6175456-Pleurochrysis_carterae.AAC.5
MNVVIDSIQIFKKFLATTTTMLRSAYSSNSLKFPCKKSSQVVCMPECTCIVCPSDASDVHVRVNTTYMLLALCLSSHAEVMLDACGGRSCRRTCVVSPSMQIICGADKLQL